MKLFTWLSRIFRHDPAEDERRREIEYRMKAATVRRHAETMKRNAERARKEAVSLQQAGDHNGAVAKALDSKNFERQYQSAMSSIRSCEGVHEQAKVNKAMTELMNTCNEMMHSVVDEVNPNDVIRTQQEYQETMVKLGATQEALTSLQEGFEPGEDPAVRNAEGEAALEAILADAQMAQPAVLSRAAAPVLPAAEQAAAQEDAQQDNNRYREYLNGKRQELLEMM